MTWSARRIAAGSDCDGSNRAGASPAIVRQRSVSTPASRRIDRIGCRAAIPATPVRDDRGSATTFEPRSGQAGVRGIHDAENLPQTFSRGAPGHLLGGRRGRSGPVEQILQLVLPFRHPQFLPRSGDREPLLVEKLLDLEHEVDILAAVETLPGAALGRGELRDLRLPEAQHVGLGAGELATLADLVEELARDLLGHLGSPPGRRAVQTLNDETGRPETEAVAGGDLDRRACARIAAEPGAPRLDAEAAEPADQDRMAAGERAADPVEDGADADHRFTARQPAMDRVDRRSQIGLRCSHSPSVAPGRPSPPKLQAS